MSVTSGGFQLKLLFKDTERYHHKSQSTVTMLIMVNANSFYQILTMSRKS